MPVPDPPPTIDVTQQCSTPLAAGSSTFSGLSTGFHGYVQGASQHTVAPVSDHIVVVGFTGRWPTAAHRRQHMPLPLGLARSAEACIRAEGCGWVLGGGWVGRADGARTL